MENRGFVIWFTGLSGSGKTTVALLLKDALLERGVNVELLDGDEIRENISGELGFTKKDRNINVRRIAYVAQLLARNGVAVIVAAVSPYEDIRNQIRKTIDNFIEVHVDCPLDVCEKRDVKGLYRKARSGEIKNFTGLDDPYEEPNKPELRLETSKQSPDCSADMVLRYLETNGRIPELPNSGYSPEEEKVIQKKLADLGYM